MFDLIVGAMSALNQVGFLVAGAMCGGLGAVLVGSRLHWRLRAARVTGTVIGVRQGNNKSVFYPVYRYALPNGASGEATSDTGSSATDGMRTGSQAALLVFADHPDRAADAGSYASEWIGGILVAAGAVLLYLALTMWPLTRYTWIVLIGLAFYGASKFRRVVPKPGDPPQLSLSRTVLQGRIGDAPVRPVEEVVSTDVAERKAKQRTAARKAAPWLIAFGVGLLAVSVHVGRVTYELMTAGQRGAGTVVALESVSSGDSSTYHPVVRFTDGAGEVRQFRDSAGSNPPSYRSGESVKVLYLAENPQKTATIDRGVWNWLAPGLLVTFGAVLVLAGFRSRRAA